MTPPALRRGWCPSLDAPMESGDGWLVRVAAPEDSLSPDQASAIGRAAARHGNGAVDLTARGNLQLRGMRPDTLDLCARDLRAAGLASPRRHVLIAPRSGLGAVADHLSAALSLLEPDGKLVVALDRDDGFRLDEFRADLWLRRSGEGWSVALSAGRFAPCRGPEIVIDIVQRVQQYGFRRVREAPAEALSAAFGVMPAAPAIMARSPPIGTGIGDGLLLAAPPFGRLDAAFLDGVRREIIPTPWRALFASAADAAALITDPDDPRLGLVACPGSPACSRAQADTRADADRLAAQMPGLRAHLSGCAKGCAQPSPAPVTLVARNGSYDMIRNGNASAPPVLRGIAPSDLARVLT